MSESVDDLYKELTHTSLLRKHLTEDVFKKLKDRKTKLGGTLADCIRSGCKNYKSNVGLYACDPGAYDTFKELFDPVICDYHKVDKVYHPACDLGNTENIDNDFKTFDTEGYIISTRVRVGRTHEGYPFPPVATDKQRKEMEDKTRKALDTLTGELKGKYYPLEGMSKKDNEQLINDHFMFKNDDKMLDDACGYNGWPKSRGIFHNEKKTFLVWINEEDHLRFISMQQGGDIAAVYKRLVTAIKKLEEKLTFARDDAHGYLTFCPTNLGTTLRASVHIKVPKLAKSGKLGAICEKYYLQPRGIHGEHTESVGGVYDISNKHRLGLTEYAAMTEMYNGIKKIIEEEKKA